jgi:hypothetical protein
MFVLSSSFLEELILSFLTLLNLNAEGNFLSFDGKLIKGESLKDIHLFLGFSYNTLFYSLLFSLTLVYLLDLKDNL